MNAQNEGPRSECNPPRAKKTKQTKRKPIPRKGKIRARRIETRSFIPCRCGIPGCRGTQLKRVKVTRKNRNIMCALFGAKWAWERQPNGCPAHQHVIMLHEAEGEK